MSRRLKRLNVGGVSDPAVKPYLMLEGETRKVSIDFKAFASIRGTTLSSAVWEAQDGVTVSSAAISSGTASVLFTADTAGIWPVTCLATFANGEKARKVWRADVRKAFPAGFSGTNGSGSESGEDPGGTFDAGVVAFETDSYTAEAGVLSITVTVKRLGGVSGAASVMYSTQDGTATAGEDYVATDGFLSWDANDQTDRTFEIELLSPRDGGTVNLILSNATWVTIGDPGVAVLEILGTGQVRFVDDEYTVADDQASIVVYVERLFGSAGAASVDYETVDGTAVEPTNYTATSGTVNWADQDATDQPITVAIEPLESVTELEADYLPSWQSGTADPRRDGFTYDYRYGSTTYSTEDGAVSAAQVALGYSIAKLPIWRRKRNGENPSEPSPLEVVAPGEDEFLNFQYVDAVSFSYLDTSRMYSSADYSTALALTVPPADDYPNFTGYFNLGIPLNTYFYANRSDGRIAYINSASDPRPQPVPTAGVRGWTAGNNCVDGGGFFCPYDPASGVAQELRRGMTDIGVRRVVGAPPIPGSEFPDWPIDPENFWWDEDTDTKYSKEPWVQVSGSYRWLSRYSVTGGGTSSVQRKPLGPVLPVGHPDDNETFWTAARDAAVAAGTLPSSVTTYNAAGTGGITTFPRNASHAWQRTYKLPLSFTVELSNAVGAELIEPDTTTVYIIPA